jgi:hypothetical protein
MDQYTRRVFVIDVGNMPARKAGLYMQGLMADFKKKSAIKHGFITPEEATIESPSIEYMCFIGIAISVTSFIMSVI